MMFCNDCHSTGWNWSSDTCPKCGGTNVSMTFGYYTKEELDNIAEERGDEFGICNTGNEVIEPLAHRNDGKGIFYACQDPLPLRPSECFTLKDLDEVVEDLKPEPYNPHIRNAMYDGLTWEKLYKVLYDITPENAKPVQARDPRLYIQVPVELTSHLNVDYTYIVPRNDGPGAVTLLYAGNGIFDIVQLTDVAIKAFMKETGCSEDDCLVTRDVIDLDTLYRHILHAPPRPIYQYKHPPRTADELERMQEIKEQWKKGELPPQACPSWVNPKTWESMSSLEEEMRKKYDNNHFDIDEYLKDLQQRERKERQLFKIEQSKESWLSSMTKQYAKYISEQLSRMINFRFR